MRSINVWIWITWTRKRTSLDHTSSLWWSHLTAWSLSPPADAREHWTQTTVSQPQRRAAVFVSSTLISDVTWTGSGSMSPAVMMLTTALGPALIWGAQIQHIARCWACTTLWTRRHRPPPAVSLRTWNPSQYFTTLDGPPKWSSSQTWLSSPVSVAEEDVRGKVEWLDFYKVLTKPMLIDFGLLAVTNT